MTDSIPIDARVLVVDREPARRATTEAAVAASGAAVASVATSHEARAVWRESPAALLVVEGSAGAVDALELVGVLRAAAHREDLPAILLDDADADAATLDRLLAAGAIDRLQRPFAPALLTLKVGFALGLLRASGTGSRTERPAQLLRLNELMVAGLIHDLRTPLMAINLSAEVALARSGDDAVQQAARRIRSSGARMSRIFDHLMNLSRVSSGVEALALAPANLRDVVHSVLDDVRGGQPTALVELSEEGEFSGVFDAALMARVVRRLLDTALANVGTGEPVTMQLDGQHRDRLSLVVSIARAIPADEQERLFVPAPKTAGREAPGLGLGLHAIDAFVRAHGGSVLGRSRAPEGTIFELMLPRRADAAL